MTGPEHYREAERLAKQANHWTYGDGGDPVVGAALAAEAQVHATLALAAAAAEAGGLVTAGDITGELSPWGRALGGGAR
jgi:hypothetical protein